MSWIEKQYPVGCEIICPDGQVRQVVAHFQDMPVSAFPCERGAIVEIEHGQRIEVPESFLYEDGSSKVVL